MPKVKVVELTGFDIDYDTYYGPNAYALANITDWDEVTDEEYEALKYWAKTQGRQIVILEEKQMNYKQLVSQYIEMAQRDNEKHKELMRKQEERARKREEAAAKKTATIQKRKEAKEKEEYEKLREKYGHGNP